MDIKTEALKAHQAWKGKIEVTSRAKVENFEDLSLAYTPGVAYPCLEIEKDPALAYEYTRVNNLVAVISNGTAVLGLGDIGPLASLPVMEGKSALFKTFAGVDAIPIVIESKNVDEIVHNIALISKSFGGINLEDIKAPECFEIEEKLKNHPMVNIPVFHDDQHGTAIVVVAGLINALKVVGKEPKDVCVVINGAGAAGCAICKLIMQLGVKDIIMVDRFGILHQEIEQLNPMHQHLAKHTNVNQIKGDLNVALKHADIFIGVSAGNILTADMVDTMKKDPIVFAMANPTPEISYEEAMKSKVKVFGTGRGDYPNQINNVLAFPGIFKGLLASRKKEVTDQMLIDAAYAIASCVKEPTSLKVIPSAFEKEVVKKVAETIAK
ncbi:MAG: NADP-dependent malic enzyme [Erysipelotrichaceae bacterium]